MSTGAVYRDPTRYVSHQQNNSPTKAAYSFTKEKRFHTPSQHRNDALYLPPVELFSTKSVSFGYGKKADVARHSEAPPPGSYSFIGEFEGKGRATRGFTFGLGREKTRFGDPLEMTRKIQPGVGAYSINDKLLPKPHGGYIGQKLGSCLQQDKDVAQMPGPGLYDITADDIRHSGNYVLSKFKNPEMSNYRIKTDSVEFRSRASPSTKLHTVGPGSYEQIDKFNPQGTYKISKHTSTQGWTIGKSRRKSIVDEKNIVPGPGVYQKFSIFGDQ